MSTDVICTHCRSQMQYRATRNTGLVLLEFFCYALGFVVGIIGLQTSAFFSLLAIGIAFVGYSLRSAADRKGWVCPNCGYHFDAVDQAQPTSVAQVSCPQCKTPLSITPGQGPYTCPECKRLFHV